ncbi:MAG: DUF1963 domain-containing protein [Planctomycetota bacterium]
MPAAHKIKFCAPAAPDGQTHIKFGGQPTWVGQPAWPLSRSTGKQMRFIAQIDLSLVEGYSGSARWGYLFMTDPEDDYVDGTWEPEFGENCFVIGEDDSLGIEMTAKATGPSLYRMVGQPGATRLKAKPAEFGVNLESREEPAFLPEAEIFALSQDQQDAYAKATEGNKIGGTPNFLQGDEFPGNADDWLLVLQLDSASLPFSINFGDAGIGYAFVSRDGLRGRFLWQCC